MNENEIKIIEVRSELGAGTRGASLGVQAMEVAALNMGSKYFGRFERLQIETENHRLLEKSKTPFANHIAGVLKVYDRLWEQVSTCLRKEERFPIVLAGDHSTAAATITGIRHAFPDDTLGVVWIDAHGDLHTPYTSPTGNMHGMPLAASMAWDNEHQKRNDIGSDTKVYWTRAKEMASLMPKIRPENLVFIGLRDTEKEEDEVIAQHGIKVHRVADVRKQGAAAISEQTLEHLSNCDRIYVSFDVDSMDCELLSKGTGTPVPNGLSEEEATALMLHLLQNERVCCFEVCEVNPTLDNKGNCMGEAAFRILEKSTNVVLNRP